MRKVHISFAKQGDVLARPVLSANGSNLIGVGVKLTDRYIERLQSYGVDYLFLEDRHTTDIFPEEIVRDETRKKAIETVYKTMVDLTSSPSVKNKAISKDMGLTYQKIFSEILTDLTSNRGLMVSLSNLHVKEGYLFHHSVNVGILAGIMGMAKGYNRIQLTELGVGALLFDIGMTVFPDELWQKNTDFTGEQRERIKKHTEEGFNLLRKQFDVSLLSAHCALQHHERYDGTGYPRGLKQDEIHEYAQIVAIADVYDALTSPRPYRIGYSPGEAIEFLYANGNQWFNVELIKIFCSHIAVYPIATTVQLNTGQIGVVTALNASASHRPIVRIIQEPGGHPVYSAYEIDLQKQMNITIARTI
ncbi:HD-GYP domain-containing protein [Paenibacillus thalictri]|uniref:HD-GYP domain-containing protein n=1 Tax=Paenibacillus thalictri TaxID=2527873 RepID=A0A4Q9DW71_9BACL|nr:HD-GYP domain-containing protein [Paenibacillus thalictri]TBL81314.1 HD-GYP domain-containing protein [Paenibacillus thalictri]